jgi:hypothetical protein
MSLQMALGSRRRCRWPAGVHVFADGFGIATTLQMAGWCPCLRRWLWDRDDAADGRLVPYLRRWLWDRDDAADGRLVSLSLQMALGWRRRCRWPAGALSPQMAPLLRPCRAGLDGAPPQTPKMGPQPHLLSRKAWWMRLERFQPARLRPRRGDYRPRLNPSRCLPAGVGSTLAQAGTRVSSKVRANWRRVSPRQEPAAGAPAGRERAGFSRGP